MSRKKPVQVGRICAACEKYKATSEFYLNSNGHPVRRCKTCYPQWQRDQRAKHHEKRVAYDHARGNGWDRNGRDKWNITAREKHDGYLRRTYGITLDDYERLLERQGYVCAICRGECNRSTTDRLCVDHNHKTGAIRGLLCFQCNIGLGKFKDDKERLARAIDYLEEDKSDGV